MCYGFAPPQQLTKDTHLLSVGPFRSSHYFKKNKYLIEKGNFESKQGTFTHTALSV